MLYIYFMPEPRIAHLILTHKHPGQLARMIHAMDHPQFDFYIHLDKKSDLQAFIHLSGPRVKFIQERVDVLWAGWGTIQATLNGFREIKLDEYLYINVISGQDFPAQPVGDLYDHLIRQAGTEFITCESIDEEWTEAAPRVRLYHLINLRIPGKHRLEKLVNRLLPRRKYPIDHKIVGRANWFTLTPGAVKYILDFLEKHPEVSRYYWYCWGADEFIFSTVLYNSTFREQIRPNLIYVDWTGQTEGHPRILTAGDTGKIRSSGKFFARKLDMEKDPLIFDLLEKAMGVSTVSS